MGKGEGPTKAGHRKLPADRGKHTTSEWDRKRAKWLRERIGVSFYYRPRGWIQQGETS